ncbi:MAG: signal peptidase II, partial [Ginsengibacter sp.]
MKKRTIFLIIALIVVADQVLKIFVKTHYHPGESHPVLGNWFQFYFIENEGLAYGWKFGGEFGKIALTLFRLTAVIFGIFYLNKINQNKYHRGYIICVALVFAGALGNLIDSMFYGLIFDKSSFSTYAIAKIFPSQ